ncbi:brachyurin-like [Zophobas morio]|uniref:brachyurin-like n=1 Tax=Zophobas morio TaxID=2755281 RepID=UPI003083AA6F
MKIILLTLFVVFTLKAPVIHGNKSRIIGGFPTTINQYPFAAAIDVQTPTSKFFCGGTLHTQQFVITAGQCVDGAVLFTIHLGSISRSDPNRLTLSTSKYFLHPNYNPATLENDIALIQFRMPIEYTDSIKPIPYLALEPLPSSRRVSTIGWGQTSDASSQLPDEMTAVFVVSLNNNECQTVYGNQIVDTMVCVEGNYNEGACHGDTGGPLVDIYSRYFSVHVGVSSFVSGNGCESTDPSGYTRTYPYVAWIQNITSSE